MTVWSDVWTVYASNVNRKKAKNNRQWQVTNGGVSRARPAIIRMIVVVMEMYKNAPITGIRGTASRGYVRGSSGSDGSNGCGRKRTSSGLVDFCIQFQMTTCPLVWNLDLLGNVKRNISKLW